MSTPPADVLLAFDRMPRTDRELLEFTETIWGIRIPRRRVCPNHVAPAVAYCDAFFARHPVTVWKASRGLGGKTRQLATLAITEQAVLGADVRLLGGSGAQAELVHEYMRRSWERPRAPRSLLVGDPTQRETRLTNGGHVVALLASQTSIRGPHPQRLRFDEVDEAELGIFNASTGQTMEDPVDHPGVMPQTVLSSTHHNPDGTMTYVLNEAGRKGWPIYEWCFRESSAPGEWLTESMIATKRAGMPDSVWNVEVELQEPSPEARAILPAKVEECFNADDVIRDDPGQRLIIEEPDDDGWYATGADWARDVNWTIIVTYRIDVRPYRLVAWTRVNRIPVPQMVQLFNGQVAKYGGTAAYDHTSLGGRAVEDLLTVEADGVDLVGRKRADIFADYISAIEQGAIRAPRIEFMYTEHKYARNDDLYGRGHPPDSIVAAALALYAATPGNIDARPILVGRR